MGFPMSQSPSFQAPSFQEVILRLQNFWDQRGCVLLLRGIDAPDPAVLEALNAVLEVDASTRRSALVAGRTVQVAEGFYVICTSRESQHALTPALASRFLAVAWGDEAEGAGDKLVGQLSFEALVLHYTRAAAGGVAAVAARAQMVLVAKPLVQVVQAAKAVPTD